jgi:hypothetical protein
MPKITQEICWYLTYWTFLGWKKKNKKDGE